MSMPDNYAFEQKEQHDILSKMRMAKAREMLRVARIDEEHNAPGSVCNRTYYAIFHAMRAVMTYADLEEHKHSHLISEFRRCYIKTGLFDAKLSEIIGTAFQIRNESDYDDNLYISGEDAREQIENAELFLNEIQKWLDDKWNDIEE